MYALAWTKEEAHSHIERFHDDDSCFRPVATLDLKRSHSLWRLSNTSDQAPSPPHLLSVPGRTWLLRVLHSFAFLPDRAAPHNTHTDERRPHRAAGLQPRISLLFTTLLGVPCLVSSLRRATNLPGLVATLLPRLKLVWQIAYGKVLQP